MHVHLPDQRGGNRKGHGGHGCLCHYVGDPLPHHAVGGWLPRQRGRRRAGHRRHVLLLGAVPAGQGVLAVWHPGCVGLCVPGVRVGRLHLCAQHDCGPRRMPVRDRALYRELAEVLLPLLHHRHRWGDHIAYREVEALAGHGAFGGYDRVLRAALLWYPGVVSARVRAGIQEDEEIGVPPVPAECLLVYGCCCCGSGGLCAARGPGRPAVRPRSGSLCGAHHDG
mmetsp:Transcript_28361/g.73354  ORF Transcript_28361/g.73354 Transcript_28361/m.73354 type:complete len:224 (-) Transcript_28361:821-1492(-)